MEKCTNIYIHILPEMLCKSTFKSIQTKNFLSFSKKKILSEFVDVISFAVKKKNNLTLGIFYALPTNSNN